MSNYFTSGIECLALIARFHQIPVEPNALLREFQHNDSEEDKSLLADINLVRAAKSIGFKAKFITDTAVKLSSYVLSAIARHADGHFFIIAKITHDEVLVQDITDSSSAPTTHTFDELSKCWLGRIFTLICLSLVVIPYKK